MRHRTENSANVLLALLLFLLPFQACSETGPRVVETPELEAASPGKILGHEQRVPLPGPPPFSEKMEPVTPGSDESGRLWSLSFQNAALGDVLLAVTRDMSMNLSLEPGVDLTRLVTVHIKDATFRELLDMVVVKAAGYAWKMQGDCLEIKRFEERIYELDYLDMVGHAEMEVGGDMLASSVDDAGVTALFEVKTSRKENQTDVWTGVREALEGLKSPEGVLQINRGAGIIYMADMPSRIATMVRFLDSLAESVQRQVFIEAKIIEVTLKDAQEYGIDWSSIEVDFTSTDRALPDLIDLTLNRGGSISKVLSGPTRVAALLDFLQTQGDVSVLSNPQLSVMNGQSAVMTVGSQYPYGSVEGANQDTGQDGVIRYDVSIVRAILGLQLGITPQISRDGVITLHIVPTVTKIQSEAKVEVPITTTQVQAISNPVIDLQELATTVRVRSGQTVILAGLIRQLRQKNHSGLPWLNRIPLLGNLFKHAEDTEENSELVILITPHVQALP